MHLTRNFVDLAPQAKEEIQAVMGEVLKRFPARKAELIEEIAKLHAEKLTLEELRELSPILFYAGSAPSSWPCNRS